MKMRGTTKFDRRTLLGAFVACGGLGLLRLLPATGDPTKAQRALAMRVVKLLGLRFATNANLELDVGPVLAQLFGVNLKDIARLDRLGDEALRGLLQERVRTDYAAHRLISSDGWWLTATEANALTLAAHLHENQLVPTCYAVPAWQEQQRKSHG